VLSARGITANPEKNVRLAITKQNPLKMCNDGLLVLKDDQPPSKGRRIDNVKINAIIDLKNTTSCKGINVVKYFTEISVTEKKNPATKTYNMLN
tara:strand:+ start:81 stop:362 length:282 start_codon:yes stop_codon:yes gene_type:complete